MKSPKNTFYYAPKEAQQTHHEISGDGGQRGQKGKGVCGMPMRSFLAVIAVVLLLVAGGVVGGVVGSKAIASQSKDNASAAQGSNESAVVTTIHMHSTSPEPDLATTSPISNSTTAAISVDENHLIATTSSSTLSTSSTIRTLSPTAALAEITVTPFSARTYNTFNRFFSRTISPTLTSTQAASPTFFLFQPGTYYKILNLEADPATPQALRSNATGPDDPWNNSLAVEPQQIGLSEQLWIFQPVPSSWLNASIQDPNNRTQKVALYWFNPYATDERLAILSNPDLMDEGAEMEILF